MGPRVAACALLGMLACAPVRPPDPVPTPPPREGRASYAFLPEGRAGPANLGANEQFWSPSPMPDGTPLPEYPLRALEGGAGSSSVFIRIVIDEKGKVAEVLDSPKGTSTPGPYAAEFRGAVEEAVRRWSFQPGVIWRFRDGNDLDGDGKPDYRVTDGRELVSVYYDLRFDFEIVDGKGVVTKQ